MVSSLPARVRAADGSGDFSPAPGGTMPVVVLDVDPGHLGQVTSPTMRSQSRHVAGPCHPAFGVGVGLGAWTGGRSTLASCERKRSSRVWQPWCGGRGAASALVVGACSPRTAAG